MKRTKKHGCLWWALIGWWWHLLWWVFVGWWWYPLRWGFSLLRKKTPAAPNETASPAEKDTYVYVTLKGKKFHYDLLCPAILNSKEIKMDLSKARRAGYTACDKCCFEYLHE